MDIQKIMNIIVISLERAAERRKKIKDQLQKLNIEATIMDAVDGNLLSPDEKNKSIKIGRWRVGEAFKPGEIGCTMSHIKALKLAKEKNWSYVIVLEDDIVLADDFEKRINILLRILPSNWEHIYLSGIPSVEPPGSSLIFPNLIPSSFTECTHSMMINSSAYDKIVDKLSRFETTTDDIYCNMMEKGHLFSLTYYPFVAYANDEYTYIWEEKITREHKSKKYFKNKL